jgi:tripartite-type tricarboxylate transporter receptor subunit TctC
MRIIASIGTLLAVALACATPVQAQEFPSRPVKLIVPYAAGGGTDIVARIVAQKLQDKWGPAVIVENRAGAGGNVGAEAVFTAAPDGYTLLFTAQGPLVVNQYLFEKLSYEPEKFTPVSLVVVAYSALLANPKVPAQNLRELIAYAKANPNKLSYSSAGIGSASHLAAELFKSEAGIEMVHVPNKGMSPALVDVMGGQVQAMFASVPALLTEQSDHVRPIAMAEKKRSALMPALPTISESGLPGFEVANLAGLLGPAGLDPSIVKKLHAEIIGILDTPDMKDRIKKLGYDVLASPPEEFGVQIRNDVVRWSEVVKKADIPLN